MTDSLSLRLEYIHPPTQRNKFYKEIDRLLNAQTKWVRSERFLKAAIAASEQHQPPESATAVNQNFSASLVLRHFSVKPNLTQVYIDRYTKGWDIKNEALLPMLVSDNLVRMNQLLNGFIHFQGAINGDNGVRGNVISVFKMTSPDGTVVFENKKLEIWQDEAPSPKRLQIGANNLIFSLDNESQLGEYKIEAQVCDKVANKCVELIHSFTLIN